jgi:hypothetical protein
MPMPKTKMKDIAGQIHHTKLAADSWPAMSPYKDSTT